MDPLAILSRYGLTPERVVYHIESEYHVRVLRLCIVGSHLWGTSDENSDLDIRGIIQQPTDDILSLRPPIETIDSCKKLSTDVDITLHEVGKVFRMLLAHNGNAVESLLAPSGFYHHDATPLWYWREIGFDFLTKKLANYYIGYYISQRKRCAKSRGGKSMMHAYREIMAGTCLMRWGHIFFDLDELTRGYESAFGPMDLLKLYRTSKSQAPLTNDELLTFEAHWDQCVKIMRKEEAESFLVDEYKGAFGDLNEKLLSLRCSY